MRNWECILLVEVLNRIRVDREGGKRIAREAVQNVGTSFRRVNHLREAA